MAGEKDSTSRAGSVVGAGIGIEKFDGSDFAFWKMQIEDYLCGRDLQQPLLESKMPDGMKESEWKQLDRQVLGLIRLTLTKAVAHNVIKETTTAGLMATLTSMYEKPSANNKVHLMKKLFRMTMAEGTSATNHLNEFNETLNSLATIGISFDDEICALILLASLPNSWETVRTAVSHSVGKEKLKYGDVREQIKAEELRRRDMNLDSYGESAYNVDDDCSGYMGNGRGRSKSRGRGKGESSGPSCWNCGRAGHIKRNCKEPKKKTQDANMFAEYVSDALNICVDSPAESWVLDSGASWHITAARKSFITYTAGKFGKVLLADNSPVEIVGIGDVRIKQASGSDWILRGVRHIPQLKRNLVSVGQLDEEGHTVQFHRKTWKISKGAMVIAKGSKKGTLYTLDSSRKERVCLKGRRVSEKPSGLKSEETTVGESCIVGQQKKVSFLEVCGENRVVKSERVKRKIQAKKGISPGNFRKPTEAVRPPGLHCVLTAGGERRKINEAEKEESLIEWEPAKKPGEFLHTHQSWKLTGLPKGKRVIHWDKVYRPKGQSLLKLETVILGEENGANLLKKENGVLGEKLELVETPVGLRD